MLTPRVARLLLVLLLAGFAQHAHAQGLLGFTVAKEQTRFNLSNSPMPNLKQPLVFEGTSYNILIMMAPLKAGFTYGRSTAPIGASPEAVSIGWGGLDAGMSFSHMLPQLPPPMMLLGTAHMGLHVYSMDGNLRGALGTGSLGAELYFLPIAQLPVAIFGRAQAIGGWAYVTDTTSWDLNNTNGLVSGGSLAVGVMLNWAFGN